MFCKRIRYYIGLEAILDIPWNILSGILTITLPPYKLAKTSWRKERWEWKWVASLPDLNNQQTAFVNCHRGTSVSGIFVLHVWHSLWQTGRGFRKLRAPRKWKSSTLKKELAGRYCEKGMLIPKMMAGRERTQPAVSSVGVRRLHLQNESRFQRFRVFCLKNAFKTFKYFKKLVDSN